MFLQWHANSVCVKWEYIVMCIRELYLIKFSIMFILSMQVDINVYYIIKYGC